MGNAARPIEYDTQLMAEDMAVAGLNKLGLAQKAGVADMTVIRFLRGEQHTAPTAQKLAKALGYSTRRYIISSRQAVA